jgi:hypothetical protein
VLFKKATENEFGTMANTGGNFEIAT